MALLSVFVAFILGVSAYYIRSCILLSLNQKHTACRLRAHLMHLRQFVLDRDLDGIYNLGQEWHEELSREANKQQSKDALIDSFLRIEDATKDKLYKAIDSQDGSFFQNTFSKHFSSLNSIPPQLLQAFIDNLLLDKQNMLEAKSFISDVEASNLGPDIASTCLQLKMDISSNVDNFIMLICSFLDSKNDFPNDEDIKILKLLYWNYVRASKNIEKLVELVNYHTSKSALELTITNLKLGLKLSP